LTCPESEVYEDSKPSALDWELPRSSEEQGGAVTRLAGYPGEALRLGWLLASGLLLIFSASGELRGGAAEEQARQRLQGVGIPFIPNSGQTDAAVAYYSPTFAGTVYVTRDGRIVYSLPEGHCSAPRSSHGRGGWSLTETLVGGRALPSGSDPSSTRVSYFLGNDPARWRSGLATFEAVSLGEVWPGIRMDLGARGGSVEKLFTVAPGGDPSRIRVRVAGAQSLRTDETGALIASTGPGEVRFTPPRAYQQKGGARHMAHRAVQNVTLGPIVAPSRR
jgi:hypothetical protein